MKLDVMQMSAVTHAGTPLIATHEVCLVVLSVAIAIITSYTALDLAERVTLTTGRARSLWLAGGAGVMGLGVWSMHFVAMLAYHLSIGINYDASIVLGSLMVAIVTSGVALFVVSRQRLGWLQFLTGGIFMGVGIACMHYTGMAAMHLQAIIQYDSKLVILSFAIAIGASLAALWLGFHLRSQNTFIGSWQKLGSAVFMGAAITGMHYTAMAAVNFVPIAQAKLQPLHPLHPTLLAVAIGSATLVILGITLFTSLIDRRSRDETARKAQEASLKQANEELESKVEERTAQLRQANEQLQSEISERRRAGEEVRFLQKMTQAISEAVDFHSALGVVLQQVCEVTGWGFGEAWIPNPNKKVLMYSPAWYGSI